MQGWGGVGGWVSRWVNARARNRVESVEGALSRLVVVALKYVLDSAPRIAALAQVGTGDLVGNPHVFGNRLGTLSSRPETIPD